MMQSKNITAVLCLLNTVCYALQFDNFSIEIIPVKPVAFFTTDIIKFHFACSFCSQIWPSQDRTSTTFERPGAALGHFLFPAVGRGWFCDSLVDVSTLFQNSYSFYELLCLLAGESSEKRVCLHPAEHYWPAVQHSLSHLLSGHPQPSTTIFNNSLTDHLLFLSFIIILFPL